MKKYVLLAFLSATCAAQTQNLKFMTVNLRPDGSTPPAIHFFCSQDYDKSQCLKDALALREALAPYPTRLLGEWSFYLVAADDWKELVHSQGANTVSPAFSLLLGRATVLESSLFSPKAPRAAELMKWSGLPIGEPLVDLAITHEMGHAICQDKNERRADDYGKQLREGKIPDCSKSPGWKPSHAPDGAAAASQTGTPR